MLFSIAGDSVIKGIVGKTYENILESYPLSVGKFMLLCMEFS